jgi:hypothetical protein
LPPIDIMLAQGIAALALGCLLASFAVDVAHLRRAAARADDVPDRRGHRAAGRDRPSVRGERGRGIAAMVPGDRA